MGPLTGIWGVAMIFLFLPVWLLEAVIIYFAARKICSYSISLKRAFITSFAANTASTIGGLMAMQICYFITFLLFHNYTLSIFYEIVPVFALGFVITVIIETVVVHISVKDKGRGCKPFYISMLMNLASYALLAALAVIRYSR
ncbi:MAG: hypothetical protein WC444_05950 [Candidatus Paceibacterota bacterium]